MRSDEDKEVFFLEAKRFLDKKGPFPVVESKQPDTSNLPPPALTASEVRNGIPGRVLNTPNPPMGRFSHRLSFR